MLSSPGLHEKTLGQAVRFALCLVGTCRSCAACMGWEPGSLISLRALLLFCACFVEVLHMSCKTRSGLTLHGVTPGSRE